MVIPSAMATSNTKQNNKPIYVSNNSTQKASHTPTLLSLQNPSNPTLKKNIKLITSMSKDSLKISPLIKYKLLSSMLSLKQANCHHISLSLQSNYKIESLLLFVMMNHQPHKQPSKNLINMIFSTPDNLFKYAGSKKKETEKDISKNNSSTTKHKTTFLLKMYFQEYPPNNSNKPSKSTVKSPCMI